LLSGRVQSVQSKSAVRSRPLSADYQSPASSSEPSHVSEKFATQRRIERHDAIKSRVRLNRRLGRLGITYDSTMGTEFNRLAVFAKRCADSEQFLSGHRTFQCATDEELESST
jgi:hypothetical protein